MFDEPSFSSLQPSGTDIDSAPWFVSQWPAGVVVVAIACKDIFDAADILSEHQVSGNRQEALSLVLSPIIFVDGVMTWQLKVR
jgi:hypothetical protein